MEWLITKVVFMRISSRVKALYLTRKPSSSMKVNSIREKNTVKANYLAPIGLWFMMASF
jgi:hypothetical protein